MTNKNVKTILARLEEVKLGETLEDGVDLGQVGEVLDKIGVKILDTKGELRDIGTVLEEIGNKWDQLSVAQQNAISIVMAGKRQYNNLLALFDNWDMYLDMVNTSANSLGTLQEQHEIYLESITAYEHKFHAELQKLYSNLIPEDSIITVNKVLTSLVESLNKLIEGFGGIKAILPVIAVLMANAFSSKMANGLYKQAVNLNHQWKEMKTRMQDFQARRTGGQTSEQREQLEVENRRRLAASMNYNDYYDNNYDKENFKRRKVNGKEVDAINLTYMRRNALIEEAYTRENSLSNLQKEEKGLLQVLNQEELKRLEASDRQIVNLESKLAYQQRLNQSIEEAQQVNDRDFADIALGQGNFDSVLIPFYDNFRASLENAFRVDRELEDPNLGQLAINQSYLEAFRDNLREISELDEEHLNTLREQVMSWELQGDASESLIGDLNNLLDSSISIEDAMERINSMLQDNRQEQQGGLNDLYNMINSMEYLTEEQRQNLINEIDLNVQRARGRMTEEQIRQQLERQRQIRADQIRQAQQMQRIQNVIKGVTAVAAVAAEAALALETVFDESATGAEKADAIINGVGNSIIGVASLFGPFGAAIGSLFVTLGKGFLKVTGLWDKFGDYLKNTKQKIEELSDSVYNLTEEVNSASDEIDEINKQLERFNELQAIKAAGGKLTAEEKEELDVLSQQTKQLELQVELLEKKKALVQQEAVDDFEEMMNTTAETRTFYHPDSHALNITIGGGSIQETIDQITDLTREAKSAEQELKAGIADALTTDFKDLNKTTQQLIVSYANSFSLFSEERKALNDYVAESLSDADKTIKDKALLDFDLDKLSGGRDDQFGYLKEELAWLEEQRDYFEPLLEAQIESAQALGEDSPELLSLMESYIAVTDAFTDSVIENDRVSKQAINNLKESLSSLNEIYPEDADVEQLKLLADAWRQLQETGDSEGVLNMLLENGVDIDRSIVNLENNLFSLIQTISGEFYQELIRMVAFGKIAPQTFNNISDAVTNLGDVAGSSEISSNLDKISEAYKNILNAPDLINAKAAGAGLKGFETVAGGTKENMLAYVRELYKQEAQIEKVAQYQQLQRSRDAIVAQQQIVEESKNAYIEAIKSGNEEAARETYKIFETNVTKLNDLVTEANELYLKYTDKYVTTVQDYQDAIDKIYNGGQVLTKNGKEMLQSNAEAWNLIKDLPDYEDYFYEGTYSLLMNLVEKRDQATQGIAEQIAAYTDELNIATEEYNDLIRKSKSDKDNPELQLDIKQAEENIERIQNKIDELNTKVDINVDWRETADNFEMFGNIIDNVFNTIHEKDDLIGNNLLRMTTDELYRIADIFPELLNEYSVFIDGVMYLDKARSEAFLKTQQEELEFKAKAKQKDIDNQIAIIDAEIEMLQASIENNAVTNEQIAHANEVAAQYEVGLEGDKQTAIMNTDAIAAAAASDVATNWDKAAQYMSTSMANASASIVTNLDAIGKAGRQVASQIANLDNPIYTTANVNVKSTYKSDKGPEFVNTMDELIKSSKEDITANIDGLGYEDMIAERNRLAQNAIERLQKAKAALIAAKAVIGNSFSGIGQKDKTKSDSNKDKELNDIEYEQDLYHYINQELERQDSLLKRIQSKKDTLYGSQYLKALEKEQKSLKVINNLNKIKLDMQKGDLADERAALEAAYGVKFDENGLMVNYNDLLYAKSEEVNKLAEGGKDKEKEYKKAKEEYEDMEDALDHYLDVQKEALELEEELIDNQVKILENNLEAITKKIEFDLVPSEDSIGYLDFLNSFYENDFYKSGENLSRLATKYLETADTLEIYKNGIEDLKEAYERGNISSADFNEEVRNQRDSLKDALLVLSEIEEEMKNAYKDALDEANDKLENYTESLEHYNDEMEHFINIIDLIGEGHEYGALSDIYGSQKENYMEQLRVQQKWYDNLKAQKDLLKETGQEGTEAWLEVINALEDVEDQIYSLAEDALTALKDSYTNLIDDVVNKLDKSLTNGSKIQNMLTQYERDRDLGDLYLDKPTQLYEIDSLQKEIAKTMEDMTDETQKEQLQNLYEELEIMRKQDKISEYDMERMRAKFELTQAQMALEDAQAAKNTMRLTRTSQGTWEYTFTANKDDIKEAEDKVSDAYNNLYQMSKEQMQGLEQNILDTVSEYEDALQQMYKDWADGKYESEEEFYKDRDALVNYYETKMKELTYLYNKARTDNALDAEDLILSTSKETGDELIKQIEENRDQFNEAVADMADRIGGDGDDSFKTLTNNAINDLDDAWWKYNDDIQSISNEVNISLGNMLDKTNDLEEQTRDLAYTISSEVVPALQDEIEEVIRATGAHREEAAALREKIEAYLEYINLLNQDINPNKTVEFDENRDYARDALLAASTGDREALNEALEKRFAKLDKLGIEYDETQERQNFYKYFDDIVNNGNRELANKIQTVLNSAYDLDDVGKLDEYLGKGPGYGNGAVKNNNSVPVRHISTVGDNYTPEATQKTMDQALGYQGKTVVWDTRDNWGPAVNNVKTLTQNVNVSANFPNATNSNEIESALRNISTDASQYANRKN